MKVLHCLNRPSIGGIQRLVIELIVAQKRQGINVTLMLDSREGGYYKFLIENSINVIDSGLSGGYDFNYSKLKFLKEIFKGFDLVHLHSFSVLRCLATGSQPIVYTIHGLSKGIRKENKIKYFFRESLKKYFLNRVHFFIANSEYTLNQAKKHYGLRNTPSRVVYNGIKITQPLFENKNSQKEFIIGMVSNFTPRKRIERLIQAFDLYLTKGGKGKLLMIGEGQTFEQIKKLVKELNIEDAVEMPGHSTDVHRFYQQFNIVVHPSDNEGFGLIGVEAYINGKPVLAYADSGGLKEIIQPLEPENIVRNNEELAEKMLHYYQKEEDSQKKVQQRINYAKNNFSIERMERDYFEVYNSLLGKS